MDQEDLTTMEQAARIAMLRQARLGVSEAVLRSSDRMQTELMLDLRTAKLDNEQIMASRE